MKTKSTIVTFLKPIALGFIVMTTIISCNEIARIVFGEWEETYYNGTGHSNQVIIDNKTVTPYVITLDNFTKDAFEIKELYETPKSTSGLYYWLSFNYLTVAINCREVKNEIVVFPSLILSLKWWPDAFKGTFLSRGRAKYKIYCCDALDVGGDFSYFEYFAIDNTTKKGYYWKVISEFTTAKDIGKCYYYWKSTNN